MAPPQRPAERNKEDENYEDVLAGTGINVEEEERNLARPDYYSHNSFQNPYPNRQGSFSNQHNSLGQMASNGALQRHQDGQFRPAIPEPSPEGRLQRQEARADWDAARHSQNPLWDMFLYGGTLNDRIRKISLRERLHDPQSGVLVNTQRTGPPPVARVNGLEGATRVIDRGQAILDSENKGQRLSEIMKLVCLATKTRVTGLLSASARLSIERRQHSKGQVPDEWLDIAALHKASSEPAEMGASAEAAPSLKRKSTTEVTSLTLTHLPGTHSQANDESGAAGATRIATAMQRVAKADREAEEARRAKRARRNAPNASTPQDIEAAAAAELLAVAADAEKKTTKKERKQAENRLSEAQQHKSANEAVRMAVGMGGGLLGGKKKKTYGWMNAGASGTSTPTRPVGSTTTSAAGTPSQDKTRQQTAKQKRFGTWDEDKDPGIQVRDVLPVLESDGMAPRAYIRGCERLDT